MKAPFSIEIPKKERAKCSILPQKVNFPEVLPIIKSLKMAWMRYVCYQPDYSSTGHPRGQLEKRVTSILLLCVNELGSHSVTGEKGGKG